MDKLERYISKFDIEKVKNLEQTKDKQFVALLEVWKYINIKDRSADIKALFLFLIVQNALIWYQLSWTGEDWWCEFCEFVKSFDLTDIDFDDLLQKWKTFLQNSKNNKRFLKTKTNRLLKTNSLWLEKNKLIDIWSKDMEALNRYLANMMWQKDNAKTIVFAIKMYGYGLRILDKKFSHYPFDIAIPIDSRVTKIYNQLVDSSDSFKDIVNYFFDLSSKYNIPSLHIDSILWIDIWSKLGFDN